MLQVIHRIENGLLSHFKCSTVSRRIGRYLAHYCSQEKETDGLLF